MIKVAKNILKKAKAQCTAAILSKVQQINERVRISSEGSNSPLTPSPDIQTIPKSSNVHVRKVFSPFFLRYYGSSNNSPRTGSSSMWAGAISLDVSV
jgi:hypothetical protein